MTCTAELPGGLGGCQTPQSEIKNVIICDKDVKFTWANKEVLSNWTILINQSLTIYAIAGLQNYTPTTDDPNIVTHPVSKRKAIVGLFHHVKRFERCKTSY